MTHMELIAKDYIFLARQTIQFSMEERRLYTKPAPKGEAPPHYVLHMSGIKVVSTTRYENNEYALAFAHMSKGRT